MAAAVVAFLLSEASADEIQLVYRVGGKEYRVAEFENGLPLLDDDQLVSDGLSLKGRDGVAWNWQGDFPIDPRYGWAFPSYNIRVLPKKYGEREERATVSANLRNAVKELPWSNSSLENGMLVVGWVVDGEVIDIFAAHRDAHGGYLDTFGFELKRSEKKGYPVVWVVEEGVVREKRLVRSYEYAAIRGLGPELFPDKIEKDRDNLGNTALHYAAMNGNREAIDWLLNNKAKKNAQNEAGRSALSHAAKNGRTEVVRLLLEQKGSSDREIFDVSESVRNGHFETMKVLVPDEARSKREKSNYANLLLSAVYDGYEDIAVHLMENGARLVLTKKSKKEQVLMGLYRDGFPRLAFLLDEYFKGDSVYQKTGYTVMHAVAPYADVELLEKVRSMGVGLNDVNEKNFTPLDFAIAFGNVEAICWLIDNGADSGEGANRIDPVQRAVGLQKEDSLQCLIGYGYDVNMSNEFGRTPLMEAVLLGNAGIAVSLVDAGGLWEFEHRDFEVSVAKAIQLDEPVLIQSLGDQGWRMESLLFDTWSLRQVAEFYRSEQMLSYLDNLGLELDGATTYAPKQLDRNVSVKRTGKIAFTENMQRKYGSMEVRISALLDVSGRVCLTRLSEDIPAEVAKVVDAALKVGEFSPGEVSGESVPVSITFNLPLKVDLPEEIAFDLHDLDVPPKIINQSTPNYPYALQKARISGWVEVEWIITPNGTVVQAKVIRSSHSAFEGSALRSIMRSTWKPGEKNGKAVYTRVKQRLSFNP